MAKDTTIKKYRPSNDVFDFINEFDAPHPEADEINAIMGNAIGMLALQMRTTLDLTKLIIEKSANSMSEDAIFSLFKKAHQVVAKHLPTKELFGTDIGN